ncbi:hypothetical protein OESDEN_00288 [Oesophagostomum dentatum]|uniref:Uncharacterized protein n=1 Tax=Oesophagostomum dentatum TaxID=61180 RepID=A0A0B1TV53_OESDE|nr:hypothetical protein OESDEN_00288 [Oesophagostomum dentatum]
MPVLMPCASDPARGFCPKEQHYSLLSSLPYASCSHSPPQMFRLEPDLSFLDTVFSDVLYFIDAQSTGALWTVHQFQINAEGFLKHLEKISVNNHAKPLEVWTGPDLASEYVVALDNQRNYMYIRNRFERSLLFECAYDLLFRILCEKNNLTLTF